MLLYLLFQISDKKLNMFDHGRDLTINGGDFDKRPKNTLPSHISKILP